MTFLRRTKMRVDKGRNVFFLPLPFFLSCNKHNWAELSGHAWASPRGPSPSCKCLGAEAGARETDPVHLSTRPDSAWSGFIAPPAARDRAIIAFTCLAGTVN